METTPSTASAAGPASPSLPASALAASARGPRREAPDVYALSVPAGLFTGDFYTVVERRDGVWFAVGDVTGHGLDSAIYMAMIQELLEERLNGAAPRPSAAVAAIHDALAPELPVERFVTLVLGHLSAGGRLRLTNAGHCPPLLLRRGGGVLKVPAHGSILNAFVPPGWTESSYRLERGEKLVLYTDGVFEAASPAGEELGIDGVTGAVAGGAGRDAQAVARGLVDDVTRFTAGAPLHDDLTVMVVGRKSCSPISPPAERGRGRS